MPRFAANLSMMFTEHPFLERFERAARAGFEAVEFLFPYEWPAQELAGALADAGLEQVLFNMPPGDWSAGERGLACLPGREAELREGVATAIEYALALECPRLHVMAGLVPEGHAAEELDRLYRDNVALAAREAARHGITVLIEPINPIDMPGYYLNDFDQALAILEAMPEGASARLQFDIYHCARIHGDVTRRIDAAAPWIDHFQIAGPKARNEPDDGELALDEVLAAVARVRPEPWVGCEYRPAARTEDGLGWMTPYRGR